MVSCKCAMYQHIPKKCVPSSSTCNLNASANLFISRNFQFPYQLPDCNSSRTSVTSSLRYSIFQCTRKVPKALWVHAASWNWRTFTLILCWSWLSQACLGETKEAAMESCKAWAKKPKAKFSQKNAYHDDQKICVCVWIIINTKTYHQHYDHDNHPFIPAHTSS